MNNFGAEGEQEAQQMAAGAIAMQHCMAILSAELLEQQQASRAKGADSNNWQKGSSSSNKGGGVNG